jgi:hypothetical protein
VAATAWLDAGLNLIRKRLANMRPCNIAPPAAAVADADGRPQQIRTVNQPKLK